MVNTSVNSLLGELTTRLESSGRERTASAYRSAVCSAQQLLSRNVSLSELFSPEGIHLYERRLFNKGLCNNTVSFYMRMLRAIYNKGADMELYPKQPHLFDAVYTGIDPTPKRAVSPKIFGQLQALDLSKKPNLAFARDLFLLSYCLQGISFADLANLRKTDLKGHILTYHRVKTHGSVTVALSALALEIIQSFASQVAASPYLLPLIKDPDSNTGLQRKSALRTHNRRLKKLAEMAGIDENLTSYVARHSWATAARMENIPIGVISQAMGHKTEEVTQIYLASFSHAALFEANEKVLAAANLVVFYKPVNREEDAVEDNTEGNTGKNPEENTIGSTAESQESKVENKMKSKVEDTENDVETKNVSHLGSEGQKRGRKQKISPQKNNRNKKKKRLRK